MVGMLLIADLGAGSCWYAWLCLGAPCMLHSTCTNFAGEPASYTAWPTWLGMWLRICRSWAHGFKFTAVDFFFSTSFPLFLLLQWGLSSDEKKKRISADYTSFRSMKVKYVIVVDVINILRG